MFLQRMQDNSQSKDSSMISDLTHGITSPALERQGGLKDTMASGFLEHPIKPNKVFVAVTQENQDIYVRENNDSLSQSRPSSDLNKL